MIKDRKIVLVGTGFVGMSMAYSFLGTGGISELVLVDLDQEKSFGEALDLQHAIVNAPHPIVVKSGGYEECKDAEVVVITAGTAQKPGQTRLDMTAINTKIIKSITESVVASGFQGIFVIASNPVDVMAHVVQQVSKFPAHKVIGSGTLLDSARLQYYLHEKLGVAARDVHGIVMGEHGDSSFVPWTQVFVGQQSLATYTAERNIDLGELSKIDTWVQRAAYEIIDRKRSTYYGIGLALNKLVRAILDDTNYVLPVSVLQQGEYGKSGIYTGVPAVINKQGIKEVIKLPLTADEQQKFDHSYEVLNKIVEEVVNPIIK